MKDEALKLADELDDKPLAYGDDIQDWLVEASAMIRRLVEELDKQNPSVFTILTCGCKSEFMGFPSEWDGETRECEPCVNYGSLCEQHFMEYEARPAQYTPQTKPLDKPEECKDGCPEFQICDYCQQTKPLSDEEIKELSEKHLDMDWQTGVIDFARAIEERHGIK